MINVTNEIKIYEVDGQEQSFPYSQILIINHKDSRKLINIQIGGSVYAINAHDLKVAIDNATNVNRY